MPVPSDVIRRDDDEHESRVDLVDGNVHTNTHTHAHEPLPPPPATAPARYPPRVTFADDYDDHDNAAAAPPLPRRSLSLSLSLPHSLSNSLAHHSELLAKTLADSASQMSGAAAYAHAHRDHVGAGVDPAEPRRSTSAASRLGHIPLPFGQHGGDGRGGGGDAGQTGDDDDDDDDGDADELDRSSGQALTPYLLKLSLVAGCSGLLFGWDTGICAGMLVAIKSDLGHSLSAGEQEMVVSATTVGAIFGSILAGKAADWLGRKRVLLIAALLFLLGSLEQAASNDVPQLVLGRFIVGIAVGQAAAVCPLYLAEVAPSSLRGRIVGTNSLLITGGQVVAYIVNAALFPVAHGWRWMVLASALPAAGQLFGLATLDESPRWLVNKGRYIQARRVLHRIYPLATQDMVEREVDRILTSLKVDQGGSAAVPTTPRPRAGDDGLSYEEVATQGPRPAAAVLLDDARDKRTTSKWALLFKEPQNRRALILAAGLQAFQQATGFNALMYYSSRILLIAGPPFDRNPNGFATFIALANFAGTVIAMRFVDTWGRRKLMLWTTAVMGVALAMLSGSFGMIGNSGDVTDGDAGAHPAGGHANPWALASLALMIVFTVSYALGQGIVPWLVVSEVFSGQVRSLGSGLASCANWSMNLFWSATYLSFVQAVGGPSGTFAIFAVISVASWLFTYFYLVELRGVSINAVGRAFAGAAAGAVAEAEAGPNDDAPPRRAHPTKNGERYSDDEHAQSHFVVDDGEAEADAEVDADAEADGGRAQDEERRGLLSASRE